MSNETKGKSIARQAADAADKIARMEREGVSRAEASYNRIARQAEQKIADYRESLTPEVRSLLAKIRGSIEEDE